MARWRSLSLLLVIFSITLAACSIIEPEEPLPTLAPTAESLPTYSNLRPETTAVPTTIALLPTQAIPTASPTNPPTPTDAAESVAEAFATSVAEEGDRGITTAEPVVTAEQEQSVPTPTLTPSVVPSSTPTPFPTSTSTPTPVLPPRLPETIWPSPAPYNQPVSNSPRHGVATALGGGAEGAYGPGPYSWTYSWTSFVPPVQRSTQHVPMIAGNTRDGLPPVDLVIERDGFNDHDYWLVFNECEHQGQCNASPPEAAQFFHDRVVDLLYTQGGDRNARLIVGGVNAHPCGILWLKNFVDYYRQTYGELPYVGWHFHIYPEVAPSGWPGSCNGGWGFYDYEFQSVDTAFALWQEHANNALAFVQEYGRPEDEIWFTEIGCLNYGFHQIQAPACQAEGFMQAYARRMMDWLNNDGRWVTRYAWFTNWDAKYWRATHLIWEAPPGEQWTYSSLGFWYANVVPAAAVALPWPE